MARRKNVEIEIWDNGDRTADRYSIAISGLYEDERGRPLTIWLGASKNPYSPLGFGQHVHELPTAEYKAHRGGWSQLGKRVSFLDLPAPVRRFIASEFMPEGE